MIWKPPDPAASLVIALSGTNRTGSSLVGLLQANLDTQLSDLRAILTTGWPFLWPLREKSTAEAIFFEMMPVKVGL